MVNFQSKSHVDGFSDHGFRMWESLGILLGRFLGSIVAGHSGVVLLGGCHFGSGEGQVGIQAGMFSTCISIISAALNIQMPLTHHTQS